MGAQVQLGPLSIVWFLYLLAMAPMKAMKGAKALSKGAIADALGSACEMKKTQASKVLEALTDLVAKEVKSTGKFTIPGVCMVKTRHKAAQKAGKRMAFGKEVTVKAKPARTIVKAFPLKALKDSV